MRLGAGVRVGFKIAARLGHGRIDTRVVRDHMVAVLGARIEHFVRRGMKYSDPLGTAADVQRRILDRAKLCFAGLVTTFEQPSLPDLMRARARMDLFADSVSGSDTGINDVLDLLLNRMFAKAAINDRAWAVDFIAQPMKAHAEPEHVADAHFEPAVIAPPPPPPQGEWLGAPEEEDQLWLPQAPAHAAE